MRRFPKVLFFLLLVLGAGSGLVWARKPVEGSVPAARSAGVILALYKSSEKDSGENNLIRSLAEPTLKSLGYRVDYYDIDAGLPDPSRMHAYKALLSWFRGPQMKEAKAYPQWLSQQVLAGRKVVILGNFGAFTPDGKYFTPNNYLNEFFVPFGLKYDGNWTNKVELLKVVSKDSKMVERPRPIDLKEIATYFTFKSQNKDNRAYLVVSRSDIADSNSSLIVRTPFGGLAQEGYLYSGDPFQSTSWHLNLAAFLGESLSHPALAIVPTGRVLALYKSSEGASDFDNEIRRFAAESLLKSGYQIDYQDADKGWPELAAMGGYAAIISWFRGPTMSSAAEYSAWLAENMKQGRKVVVLGNFGAFQDRVQGPKETYTRWLGLEDYNNFFSPFGLEFQRNWTSDPKLLQVVSKESPMVEYQLPLTADIVKHYFKFKSVSAENHPYLVVKRTDIDNGESTIIGRTPGGGLALEGYLYESKAPDYVLKWRLNLADFLRESLSYKRLEPPMAVLNKASDEELMTVPAGVKAIHFPLYSTADAPSGGPEMRRQVLGLYKGSEKDDSNNNLIHLRAEQVLNHLGIRVIHYDIEKGLPSDEFMEPFLGVVSWYRDSFMGDPTAYATWMAHQITRGRRLVLLGDSGLHFKRSNRVVGRGETILYQAMGMEYRNQEAADPFFNSGSFDPSHINRKGGLPGLSVLSQDHAMTEFETPLDAGQIHDLSRIHSVDPQNKVYLSVYVPRWGRTDPVVITPHGGVADRDFSFYEPPPTSDLHKADQNEEEEPPGSWRIDPFRFFSEALGLAETPRPDVTTLNGSRVFYSHIDGDGFPGISLIDRDSLSADFIYKNILNFYPLPVTVSVISRDIELRARTYYNRELQLARKIFALDNVEAASHSWSHPFNWRHGDLKVRSTKPEIDMVIAPTDLPRQITYSINFIDRYLLPATKRVEILLWTGNCQPTEEALSLVAANGCRNLNGGDPVYDTEHPTYSALCALTAQVGKQIQMYTSGRGEFLYTDGWTKNFDGQKQLVDHFERTESPRRVMPLNIYFHFYVGDRQLGLEGLKACFDYVMKSHPAPLFASQYVDSVSDWLTMRIFPKDDGWLVVNSGKCRTVRFDLPDRQVDMGRSRGVLGFNHLNQSLYVHLDEGYRHEIYLCGATPSQGIYLQQGSHYVNHWQATPGRVSFDIVGLGPAYFSLAGFPPGSHPNVEIQPADGGSAGAPRVQTDANGKLIIESLLRGYNKTYRVTIESGGAK